MPLAVILLGAARRHDEQPQWDAVQDRARELAALTGSRVHVRLATVWTGLTWAAIYPGPSEKARPA